MDFYMQSACQNYLQKGLRQESGEVFPKMFMNAPPRRVAHGYETVIHGGRTESLHQRLSEMTENQVNAWNPIRPVNSSSRTRGDSWNDQKGAFGQTENYQVTSLQSSCMQLPQDYCQTQNFDRGTTAYSYATPSLRQDRSTSLYGQPVSTFLYQRDSMQANCSSKPDLMLGNTNDPWPWTMTNTGSSYSAEDHELLQMFPYHTISESLSQPCHGLAGASSLRSRMPFTSDSSFDMSSPPPSSLHSGYSTSGTIPDESQSHLQFRAAVQNENAHPRMAWDGTLNTIQGQMGMDGFGSGSYSASHCGFRSNDPWLLGSLPATNWSNQTSEPRTISPKVLTLDSSSTIMPVKCPEIFNSDRKVADTKPKSLEDSADLPQPPKQSRKRLPAGKPPSFPEVPIIPSTNMKKITKSRARSPRTNSPIPKPTSSKVLSRVAPAKKLPSARQAKNIQPKLEAATALPACNPSEFGSTVPPAPDMSFELSPKVKALKRQESRDRFLVRSKLAGMSYKEIRKAGAFSEAESTLRGRFRTLTKEKEARVRRPEWEENDISLLRRAVRKLNRGPDSKEPGQMKVPWKHVAEYISNHGGSYHFGYATCRKKWDELRLSAGSKSP